MSKSKTKNETNKSSKSKAKNTKKPKAKKSALTQENLLFKDDNINKIVSVFSREVPENETNYETSEFTIIASPGLSTYNYNHEADKWEPRSTYGWKDKAKEMIVPTLLVIFIMTCLFYFFPN